MGELVKGIQENLTRAGFDTKGTDGVFGNDTVTAARSFQQSKNLAVTGAIDDSTWPALMQTAVPPVAQRALQLTAAFEGQGFELAIGNFDGALLTWGIVGFTLMSGEIQKIVSIVNSSQPQLLDRAFGASKAELLQLMTASKADQTTWANERTLPNGHLVQTWQAMFATFGSIPEVQAAQLQRVNDDYLRPAIATAREMGFKSELGLSLALDMHVQNGGISNMALQRVRQQTTSSTTEPDLRSIVANAVADFARPAFMEDVRRRKLTIATGQGQVHGHPFVLQNWGLTGDFPAAELA
jgi:peptidoglycan hydrolase-like protein with peptidoglycan-binding domain